MKKKTIFQCVILFFSILNIHVGMAGPEQVSMHIYGNVVDQGCDVAKSALQNIHIGDFNISEPNLLFYFMDIIFIFFRNKHFFNFMLSGG